MQASAERSAELRLTVVC